MAVSNLIRFVGITEERISVRVDNVPITPLSKTITQIDFGVEYAANADIKISIASKSQTISRELTFTANQDISTGSNVGAWGNVNWFNDGESNRFYVYSSSNVGSLPKSAKFKVDGPMTGFIGHDPVNAV